MKSDPNTAPDRRWHALRRPLFWKMFAADTLLVGITAVSFPGRTGGRLVVLIAALVVASLLLNVLLSPPDAGPGARR